MPVKSVWVYYASITIVMATSSHMLLNNFKYFSFPIIYLCNVGPPIWPWMMGNIRTDEEEIWCNRNTVLMKNSVSTMEWTFEVRPYFGGISTDSRVIVLFISIFPITLSLLTCSFYGIIRNPENHIFVVSS